jgi:Uncharacterized protein conserved in bacteria (DUF2188)
MTIIVGTLGFLATWGLQLYSLWQMKPWAIGYGKPANLFSTIRLQCGTYQISAEPQMPAFKYFIVPEGANWAVRIDSDFSIPYPTLAEAIEAAMEVARGARRCGFTAEVFVHRAQGDWASLLHL